MAPLAGMSKYWTIAIAFGLILSACGGQIVSETFGNVGTELPEPTTIATAEPTPAAESLAPFVEDTQLLGDVRVAGDQTISGQVVGTLTVARSGKLVLYGQVLEDLVVNAGGIAPPRSPATTRILT